MGKIKISNDARNDFVNDASGLLVLADGRQAAESGEHGSAEVKLDSLVCLQVQGQKVSEMLAILQWMW